MEVLGLIAGSGRFPILLAQSYKKSTGNKIEAIGFYGETNPELEQYVDNLTIIAVGQLGKLIKSLKNAGVKKAVMAGQIAPKRLYDSLQSLKFDIRGMKLFMSLPDKKADSVFGGVVRELESEGINLIDSTTFLADFLPKKGVLTKRKPDENQLRDVEFGAKIALDMGGLDVGQTVIVKNLSTVAIEAIEGTDEAIRRAGILAGAGSVIVKVAKPNQDMRFDVPVIGMTTIETMKEAGAAVLAVSEGKALILDINDVICKADEYGISIVVI
jgi:UDP-2,3-diacylglucosamine hydrolase